LARRPEEGGRRRRRKAKGPLPPSFLPLLPSFLSFLPSFLPSFLLQTRSHNTNTSVVYSMERRIQIKIIITIFVLASSVYIE
jgi:hypothetical protein